MWLSIQKIYWPIALSLYCMNFVIFLCVTVTLFSLNFMPLLAPNPGDATAVTSSQQYIGLHLTDVWHEMAFHCADVRPKTFLFGQWGHGAV